MGLKYCRMGLALCGVLAVLTGCAESGRMDGAGRSVAGPVATKSLYERLGGEASHYGGRRSVCGQRRGRWPDQRTICDDGHSQVERSSRGPGV